MTLKTTLILCMTGALGSLMIGFGGIGWSLFSAEDALIFPLVIGPYAVIAALAWWRRSSPIESKALLVTVVLVAAYGFWMFGLSAFRRFGVTNGEVAMDMTSLVAPVLQLMFVLVIGMSIGVAAAVRSARRS